MNDYAWGYRNRGLAWSKKGEQAKAAADFDQAIQADPEDEYTYNALAWLLATSYDKNIRNGKRAVELAKKACSLTDYKTMHFLGTLAAAYAETGQFDEALKWQQKALENPAYVAEYGTLAKERLKLYEEKKPYMAAREKQTPSSTPAPEISVPKVAPLTTIAAGPLKGWIEFNAPDGSFTAAFPENPRARKQRVSSGVGNIDNFTYTHEAVELTYVVSYFDFPMDGVLTLEKAAAAYALGVKGTLAGKQDIRLGNNPGLEVNVTKPTGNSHRARFYEVGQRRFQVVVEGPANQVTSAQATAFLDSFKLTP